MQKVKMLDQYVKSLEGKLRKYTLIYLVDRKKEKILLGKKKRGSSKGKFVGLGGKVESDETIYDCAIRETQEESGLKPEKLELMARVKYLFPKSKNPLKTHQEVFVYFGYQWQGRLRGCAELDPKWFNVVNIPYESMWHDSQLFLHHLLNGEKLIGNFLYNQDQRVTEFYIKFTQKIGKFVT